MNASADNLQPQRLKQSRGDPLPGEPSGRIARCIELRQSAHQPDIAVPRANRHAIAIGEEIEAGGPQLGQPGIGRGQRQHVDGEGTIRAAELDLGRESLRPSRRSAVRELREIGRRILERRAPPCRG